MEIQKRDYFKPVGEESAHQGLIKASVSTDCHL